MSQFTKLAIYKTFIELLNEEPLSKITVQDICERCGVNRNTFYYYFEDKYAVLISLLELEKSKSINDTKICSNWKESFLKAAEFALTNKKAVYHIYYSVNREQLETYLYSVMENLLRIYIDHQSKNLNISEEDKQSINSACKYAIVGTILNWIATGMEKDPADFLETIDRLFNGVIEWVLTNRANKN